MTNNVHVSKLNSNLFHSTKYDIKACKESPSLCKVNSDNCIQCASCDTLLLRAKYPTALDMSIHVLIEEFFLTYVTDWGYNKKIGIISDPGQSRHVAVPVKNSFNSFSIDTEWILNVVVSSGAYYRCLWVSGNCMHFAIIWINISMSSMAEWNIYFYLQAVVQCFFCFFQSVCCLFLHFPQESISAALVGAWVPVAPI